jgi:hypothetical protein
MGLKQDLSLNISGGYLLSRKFCDELATLLHEHPELDPHSLEIEVLESTAMLDVDAAIAVFERCHELGVTIALDDFGSGHSSLSYFRRLPVDTLKIDQMFVQSVMGDAEDLAVVESVVRLTQAFNRKLIAEGVESVEIGMLLLNLGCSVGQGFGIAHPMPAEDVPAWITAFKPDRNWLLPLTGVAHDDMPLFMAELEHRAWVRKMRDWLDAADQETLSPPLDDSACRFGKWYAGPGKKRYGHHASYGPIGKIHEAVHQLGQELVQLSVDGRREEARQRFTEMIALRDALIDRLASLQGNAILESPY